MRGFSLIELLVALGIVAVLAGLAMPGYSQAITRSLRQEARLALLRVHFEQERYFTTHLHYAARLGSGPDGLVLPAQSENRHYLLRLQRTPDGAHYTAVATVNPAGRQARDGACASLSLNDAGLRRTADASGTWRDDDPYRCWG